MGEEKSVREQRLEMALGFASLVISGYAMDIRNSEWTGVDLVAKGFCQGRIYREAPQTIERIVKGEAVV